MEAARRDLSHLSEWLTPPTWGAPPPRRARAGEGFDPGALSEWATHPASSAPRRAQARESFDPALLAEWVVNPTWGPLRRTMVRDVLAPPPSPSGPPTRSWGRTRHARTRDAVRGRRRRRVDHAGRPDGAAGVGRRAGGGGRAGARRRARPGSVRGGGGPGPRGRGPGAARSESASLEDEALVAEDAPEPGAEAPAAAEPSAEIRIDESGRFSLGGWAAQPGHITLCGVTFRDRRDAPVDPSAIRLIPDAVSNVGDGGVVVLSDSGFAPDEEGFTVLLAAEGTGSFAASGRYEVIATRA